MLATSSAPRTTLVGIGPDIRVLPAATVQRGDSLFVPLAFVSEILADPVRRAWNWTPASATLAEGPPAVPLVVRPSTTTVAREARSRLPGGLRSGHRVTIDPGHGGTDPGNPGKFFPRGLTEKDVTLAVGLLLRDQLEKRGVRVTMTRTRDTLINLGQRAPRYCTADCDLFVSLHVNSLERRPGYTDVRGFETYFLAQARSDDEARVARMENDAIRFQVASDDDAPAGGLGHLLKSLQNNEYQLESARAAEFMQSRLREVSTDGDKGVKQAGFAVLTTAKRPAILVEMGYATNPQDAHLMTTQSGQEGLAAAIAEAIVAYLRDDDLKRGAAPEGP